MFNYHPNQIWGDVFLFLFLTLLLLLLLSPLYKRLFCDLHFIWIWPLPASPVPPKSHFKRTVHGDSSSSSSKRSALTSDLNCCIKTSCGSYCLWLRRPIPIFPHILSRLCVAVRKVSTIPRGQQFVILADGQRWYSMCARVLLSPCLLAGRTCHFLAMCPVRKEVKPLN